ncbi:hypothetical protein [Nocardia arthritidis]|uniref:4Fe-4S Wbl-type domain-containing protein n=1 Tax=Nocardia arthritidis TaxID=228602 RepID=A0A6G9YPI7_9NOCA|nr:hypothetical protein [Nocardia arthritidis]QIS15112.1 hypothetical protein F5544_36415 [Nocardia arthritidis]
MSFTPTPRPIGNTIAPEQLSTTRTRSIARPTCADTPDNWDLDVGNPESWREAVLSCRACPLLGQCGRLAQSLIARGDAPRAMIWAGIAYDNAGRVVEDLDRHRVAPADRKRPLRIIHTGVRPVRGEASMAAPRRHIVLGRPLEPAGG